MAAEITKVMIYTDGACLGNPGPGGWAALLIYGNQEKILRGGEPQTTNNRMELTAAIRAFESLKRYCEVELYTDSEYLRRGITEWLAGWKARNWRRKDGPLANADLWQELDKLQSGHKVNWHWLQGHAGNLNNERVDQIARQSINEKHPERRTRGAW
jgi:ribonuclease HI